MDSICYSIVVPCYKDASWLGELVARVEKAMSGVGKFELILVNDCSPDGGATWSSICLNAEKYPWVYGINLLYNVGQFQSLLCGISESSGEYIITMDDDLQHPPEELPKLIDAMKSDPDSDVIIGAFAKKQHSLFRRMGSRLIAFINKQIYNRPVHIQTTSFRIFKRVVALALLKTRTAKPLIGPMLLALSKNIKNVTVEHHPRPHGVSGYSLARMIQTTLINIVNGSLFPLRLFTTIGFISSVLSFSFAIYFFMKKLMGGIIVAGFASQIVIMTFFFGLILMQIGIVGEYIGRMINEVTGVPPYVIKEFSRKKI